MKDATTELPNLKPFISSQVQMLRDKKNAKNVELSFSFDWRYFFRHKNERKLKRMMKRKQEKKLRTTGRKKGEKKKKMNEKK